MNSDDMLSYLAAQPKKHRPTELRSDVKMLKIWQLLRRDKEFYEDVIRRHGLSSINSSDLDCSNTVHEHAISNAWGHCMQVLVEHDISCPDHCVALLNANACEREAWWRQADQGREISK